MGDISVAYPSYKFRHGLTHCIHSVRHCITCADHMWVVLYDVRASTHQWAAWSVRTCTGMPVQRLTISLTSSAVTSSRSIRGASGCGKGVKASVPVQSRAPANGVH